MTTTVIVNIEILKEVADLLDLAADITEDAKIGSAAASGMRCYASVLQRICNEQEEETK